MKKILVVDDEKPISDIIKFNMAKEGYEVLTAFDGREALEVFAAENPDIIILDEPINALDDSGTEQVRQILMKHKQRGALIIIACHDADELEFLSDEIIEIAEGKIQPKKDKKSNKQ